MSLTFRTLKSDDLRKLEKNYSVGRFEFIIVDGACKGIQLEFERALDKSVRVALRYEDYSLKCVQLEPPKIASFILAVPGCKSSRQDFDSTAERDEALKALPDEVKQYVQTFEEESEL